MTALATAWEPDVAEAAREALVVAKSGPVHEIEEAGDFLNASRSWRSTETASDTRRNSALVHLEQRVVAGGPSRTRPGTGEGNDRWPPLVGGRSLGRRVQAPCEALRGIHPIRSRDGLLAIARTDRSIAVAVEQLDRPPHLLACRNGTINLRTGDLLRRSRPPDHRGWISTTTPLLDRALGAVPRYRLRSQRRDDQPTSRPSWATPITGEVGEHLLPDFYGAGANGKSTFITAITGVLREHAAIAPEGLLVEQKHEQHPERLAMLRGRVSCEPGAREASRPG